MTILKIKQPGLLISFPGIQNCRSPVEIDISKLDIRLIFLYLKKADINDYEIISKEKIIKSKPLKKRNQILSTVKKDNSLEKRIKTLEQLILNNNSNRNDTEFQEQINNKLDLLLNKKSNLKMDSKEIKYNNSDPTIDTFFIPEIDTDNMKLSTTNKFQEIKKDMDLEESVRILEEFMKK